MNSVVSFNKTSGGFGEVDNSSFPEKWKKIGEKLHSSHNKTLNLEIFRGSPLKWELLETFQVRDKEKSLQFQKFSNFSSPPSKWC